MVAGQDETDVDGAFERMLAEALALAGDARAYLVTSNDDLSERLRLIEIREMSRLTSRVCYVVAWLLACRAVAAGEIDPLDELDELSDLEGLPAGLRALITRSTCLHARVERLSRPGINRLH
jgi:hypothetical protein